MQERKPDAARAPVSNPGPKGRKTRRAGARHRAPSMPAANMTEGSPDVMGAKGVHALVRVGSAAMPAPFALAPLPQGCDSQPASPLPDAVPTQRFAAKKAHFHAATAFRLRRTRCPDLPFAKLRF